MKSSKSFEWKCCLVPLMQSDTKASEAKYRHFSKRPHNSVESDYWAFYSFTFVPCQPSIRCRSRWPIWTARSVLFTISNWRNIRLIRHKSTMIQSWGLGTLVRSFRLMLNVFSYLFLKDLTIYFPTILSKFLMESRVLLFPLRRWDFI